MPNMTPLGRYRKGLDLEQEGLTANEIAKQLEFKSVSAWYSFKSYHTKKAADFVARAAGKPDEPKPNPIVEEVNRKRAPSFAHSSSLPELMATGTWIKPTPQTIPDKLKRTVTVSAKGEVLNYRLTDGVISINRPGQNRAALSITVTEYLTMVEEIKELLKP